MAKFRDLSGLVVNGITIIEHVGWSTSSKSLWRCKCHCGKEFTPVGANITSGSSLSCGCLMLAAITKHGDYKTAFYQCWQDMRQRCYNPKMDEYHNYGGRGIKVCDEWQQYLNFKNDMFSTYQKGLTLDRINNEGNYEPGNCKWHTMKQQARNTRQNKYFETPYGKITLSELSEITGINRSTLQNRSKTFPLEMLCSPVIKGLSLKDRMSFIDNV